MQSLFLVLTVGLLLLWCTRFIMGLSRGQVKGRHPIDKKLAWISRVEHPGHFWGFAFFQIVMLTILAWVLLAVWIRPAF